MIDRRRSDEFGLDARRSRRFRQPMTHDPKSLDEVFDAIGRSPFRQRFHLGTREREYLAAKGLSLVMDHARDFIDRRLAPAEPVNDGKQTPFRGHPVFIAQHATGTCCRSCLEKWHGIARGRALDERDRNRIAAALERWLKSEQGSDADFGAS